LSLTDRQSTLTSSSFPVRCLCSIKSGLLFRLFAVSGLKTLPRALFGKTRCARTLRERHSSRVMHPLQAMDRLVDSFNSCSGRRSNFLPFRPPQQWSSAVSPMTTKAYKYLGTRDGHDGQNAHTDGGHRLLNAKCCFCVWGRGSHKAKLS
jgi:hypothetical protein